MNNRTKSIYFAAFAILYFIFTFFVAGHGLHWTNSVITIFGLGLSGYYYLKTQQEEK